MKKILYVVIFFLILSCDDTKKEYYNNGQLHKEYKLENNYYQGRYYEYHDNGKRKISHYYQGGKQIDTSFYYDKQGLLREKRIWLDSIKDKVILYNNGLVTEQGYITKDKMKINNWTYHQDDKDSIVEYVIVDKLSNSNQHWIVKNDKDTIWSKSNDYKVYLSKQEISLDEVVKVRVVLMDAYFHNLSDVKVLLFKEDNNSKEYFYNLEDVKTDIFLSLKNDGIPHPEVPKNILQNHMVEFGLKFNSPGNKKIKGILREFSKGYDKEDIKKIKLFEKDLFFEKNIYVSPR